MKKLFLFLGCGIIATTMFLTNSKSGDNVNRMDLNSLIKVAVSSAESGGGYSCTVTSNCGTGPNGGSVSCTGQTCSRGWQWVKCDGKKTTC